MKKKILVVDDEETIRLLVTTTLEDEENYEIIEAEDGEEALKKAEEHHPDLMLLDVMMPKIDGFEVCRRLKSDEKTKNIYIIMLTARGQEFDKKKGEEVGVDDYFTKPFSPTTLLNKITEILG